ncbi:MAG: Glucokinase [candidate division BRC1 bacterium ADurb.BinA364]|nr:MAG: Glucokinase [candidate division BRC1 bacterium ADurb.BinA364]
MGDAQHGLGVDLGGTTTAIAMIAGDGAIVAEEHIETRSYEGPDSVLRRIGEAACRVKAQAGCAPRALGMGVPGLADIANGIVRFLPNLEGNWRGVKAREILEPMVECPVRLLNDVRTATLGELTFGHGRNGRKETMVFLALGTGVGGGVVIDGALRLGPLGAAGELGHMIVEPDGVRCGCGSQGCLECYSSGPALAGEGVRLLRSGQAPKLYEIVKGDPGKVDPKTMGMAAAEGDDAIRTAIRRAAHYLGIGIANMVVAIHPSLVVLGGGVAGIGDLLFDTVRDTLKQRVYMMPVDDIKILPSALGDKAGVLGAGALAIHGI